MPVRVSIAGTEVAGTWSSDPLVVAERQRQGLGGSLLRAWDRGTGVALGAGLSRGTRGDSTRCAGQSRCRCHASSSQSAGARFGFPPGRSPSIGWSRQSPCRSCASWRVTNRSERKWKWCAVSTRALDRLWERLSGRFALAVRRDSRYLNWKYAEPPHVRYTSALLRRGDDVDGYVVYRHFREPQGRVTQIVDLLADPADERGIKTLARWVDREARMDDSDKIRCHVTHAAFRRVLRRSGYFVVKSGIDLTVKVNAVPVPKGFYESVDEWHITLGDGELDH